MLGYIFSTSFSFKPITKAHSNLTAPRERTYWVLVCTILHTLTSKASKDSISLQSRAKNQGKNLPQRALGASGGIPPVESNSCMHLASCCQPGQASPHPLPPCSFTSDGRRGNCFNSIHSACK